MRFREVFRYELAYRVRSASTWFYAAFLFAIVLLAVATGGSGSAVHANAPMRITETIALFAGSFGMLVSAALFGDAAVRDIAAGMDPLLFTTRLSKAEFLGGRFLAALTVNAILVIALPLAHIVAMATRSEVLEPFRLAAYVQPLLLFLWPNLVLVGAILFAVGILGRQVVPVYLAAIGILVGFVTAANYWGRIDNPVLSALGDPLGINALLGMNRYWTPAEQNARLIGFPMLLLLNRVLWLAVAAGVFALLHGAFRFAHREGGGLFRRRGRVTVDAPAERHSSVAIPRAAGTFGFRTRLRQTLAVARRAFGDVVAGRAFRVVLLGTAGCVLLMGWNVTETVFETSTWPVTHLVAGTVISQRIAFIPWLVIILFAGELVWKEREVGTAEIADAMPVPDSLTLLGRFLAVVAVIAAVLAALTTGGVLMQALQGYYHFELGLYARIVFGFNFAEYVLLAALAMTIHVLVNHKYVGHIVALSAAVFTKIALELGFPLVLAYNAGPGWKYSDMNGFGAFLGPYLWFKLYWSAWALLLGVLAVVFWVRGRESGLRRRLALARARFIGPVARVAGVAIVLILGLGGFVFYNMNILNDVRSGDEAGIPQAEYEKRYARFEQTPQPMITDATLRVEIYPADAAVDLRGTYVLVNRTTRQIDSVHVYLDPNIEARSFSFDRAAKPVLTDAELGYRIFALERSLQVGDSLQLTFDVGFRKRGFPNDELRTKVVRNGTYIDRRWLPFIGYQPVFELTNTVDREPFDLAPQPPMPGPADVEARQYRGMVRNEDLVHIETIIGTTADQTAITTGALRRSWTVAGRRYFHYESEGRVSLAAPIFSGRYAVREEWWNAPAGSGQPVSLQVFYHPAHASGVDPMMRGMKASVDYYTKNFGPYPFGHQLRIVEIPPYSTFGHADPGTIAFSEDAFFGRTKKGELDQNFYGAAHETGHQWQVSGAMVRGIGYLGESFANYCAVMVTEKTYGPEAARRAYDFHMERYLRGRAEQSREVSVLDVARQTYIMYRKGAIALLTLRDFIGEAAVNAALRRFLEKYRNAGPPYPTALDQYAELRAVTPDSLAYLLTDLFETVTLWDVKAQRAAVRRTEGGAYEVTLDVVAKKVRADSIGTETEIPMNDLVEIGVFVAGGENALGAPLHLQRHRIRSGKQSITITVAREPARAGIDPYHKLIDRERGDNMVDVATTATAAARMPPAR